MKYFDLSGQQVSRLGFGCLCFKGLTYMATAYPYHDGMSEKFIGEFIEENNLRDKVQLTTKLLCWLITNGMIFIKYLMNKEDIDFYERARSVYKAKEQIACTACEYFLPCTVDINIPKVFSLWNNAYLYNESKKSRSQYENYLKDGVSLQNV